MWPLSGQENCCQSFSLMSCAVYYAEAFIKAYVCYIKACTIKCFLHLSNIMRKPGFWGSDQVWQNAAYIYVIILSKEQVPWVDLVMWLLYFMNPHSTLQIPWTPFYMYFTNGWMCRLICTNADWTKMLIRPGRCAGWSAPLFFCIGIM